MHRWRKQGRTVCPASCLCYDAKLGCLGISQLKHQSPKAGRLMSTHLCRACWWQMFRVQDCKDSPHAVTRGAAVCQTSGVMYG